MIPGRCTATLSGIHKSDRKLDTWCTACGQGRPLPSSKKNPVAGVFTQLDEAGEPAPEAEDCRNDPTGNGLHWRYLSDAKDCCRACGAGGVERSPESHHAARKFVLPAQRRRVQPARKPEPEPQGAPKLDHVLGSKKAMLERRRETLRQRREDDAQDSIAQR